MPKEKSPAIKKKLAKKGLSQLNRECSLDAFKHNLRREYHAGQTAQGTQHVAIALSVLKRSCGVDSKDRMTPKEIVAAGGKKQSMNVESINALLVKAISQIQETELSGLQENKSTKRVKWGRSEDGYVESKDGKWKISPRFMGRTTAQDFELEMKTNGKWKVVYNASSQKDAKEYAEEWLQWEESQKR